MQAGTKAPFDRRAARLQTRAAVAGLKRHAILALATLIIVLPVAVALLTGMFAGGGESWDHILNNRLLPYTGTTVTVLALCAALATLFAVPAAWIVSTLDFPGRQTFEWALILPLAVPGYVMAYAWGDLSGVAGPLQTALRDATGLSARDYWFPDVYTEAGLAFVLAATLFPYVYITARAAFIQQSAALMDAARSLGAGGMNLFFRVALPCALPAILGGLLLAMMEAAADYGAADYFGVPTLGVGIVRAWTSFGEPATAARLALVLVLLAFLLLAMAHGLVRRRPTHTAGRLNTVNERSRLKGVKAILAISLCGGLLSLTFFVPVGRLIWLATEHQAGARDLIPALVSTASLGIMGVALTLGLAFILARAAWANPGLRLGIRGIGSAGYATPGAVLGLAALVLVSVSGQALSGFLALTLLLWLYATRFVSAGLEPISDRFAATSPNLKYAAQSLGTKPLYRLWRLDLPIARPGLLAGALILFVEVLKELPATWMLAPTGWETLAVRAHTYASDERLAAAALPSLLITLGGLIPVWLLSTRLSQAK